MNCHQFSYKTSMMKWRSEKLQYFITRKSWFAMTKILGSHPNYTEPSNLHIHKTHHNFNYHQPSELPFYTRIVIFLHTSNALFILWQFKTMTSKLKLHLALQNKIYSCWRPKAEGGIDLHLTG